MRTTIRINSEFFRLYFHRLSHPSSLWPQPMPIVFVDEFLIKFQLPAFGSHLFYSLLSYHLRNSKKRQYTKWNSVTVYTVNVSSWSIYLFFVHSLSIILNSVKIGDGQAQPQLWNYLITRKHGNAHLQSKLDQFMIYNLYALYLSINLNTRSMFCTMASNIYEYFYDFNIGIFLFVSDHYSLRKRTILWVS